MVDPQKGAGGCGTIPGFSDEMTAFGCQPEFYYFGGVEVEPAALCPGVPPYTTPIPCDQCTGVPPKGWTFVTWRSGNDPCIVPSHGCKSMSCATF